MAKRGKKYQAAAKLVEPGMEYTIEEACELVRKTKVANFDESVDLDLKLGVDPRHADQMVRGTVSLPHGTGKDTRRRQTAICVPDSSNSERKIGQPGQTGITVRSRLSVRWTQAS